MALDRQVVGIVMAAGSAPNRAPQCTRIIVGSLPLGPLRTAQSGR